MKVLILGVGNAQVDAIKYLKSAGHKVVGISYREEGAGVSLVDEFALIDIVDKEAVLNFTKGKKFDLVYSIGSDVAMPTVSFVSDALGLPCFFTGSGFLCGCAGPCSPAATGVPGGRAELPWIRQARSGKIPAWMPGAIHRRVQTR